MSSQTTTRILSSGAIPSSSVILFARNQWLLKNNLISSQPLAPVTPFDYKLFMIKRSPKSSFMKNMYVFPGGTIDRADIDFSRQRCPYEYQIDELAARVAAIRELFEESGIMLLQPSPTSTQVERNSPQVSLEYMKLWRQRMHDDASQMTTMLSELQMTLSVDKLIPWSRWITPKQSPKRFDTRFYLAEMSYEDHRLNSLMVDLIGHDGKEGTDSCWMDPHELIDNFEKRLLDLAPPTFYILNELATYAKSSDLLASYEPAHRQASYSVIEPKIVSVEQEGGGTKKKQMIIFPGDPMYYNNEDMIDNTTVYHRLEITGPHTYKLFVPKYLQLSHSSVIQSKL